MPSSGELVERRERTSVLGISDSSAAAASANSRVVCADAGFELRNRVVGPLR